MNTTHIKNGKRFNKTEGTIQFIKGGGGGHKKPPPVTNIPKVTGLTATILNSNSVYFSWEALSGATSYWIYRDNTAITIVSNNYWTDNYPLSGTHAYAVAGVVNSILGPKSDPVSVTV